MKKLLIGMVVAAVTTATAAATPAPKAGKRYIVTFDAKAKQSDRDAALGALSLSASKHIATNGDTDQEVSVALVDVPAGKALPTVGGRILSIEADRRIKWIESAQISFQAAPLPSFSSVMGQLNMPKPGAFVQKPMLSLIAAQRREETWGIVRVHAAAAWPITEGKGVKVAVIDSGIDFAHPDLAGSVDGGYSAIKRSENPSDYQDDNGHGSHVAGTIAAHRDGKGVVGVAPKARLYAVKVLDADGSGNLSDVIDGLVWASKNKMDVVNMSLGGSINSEALKRAVRFARGAGVVIVASAGNSGGAVSFPGAYEDLIAVGASDSNDKVASFSSRGSEVDFIAPGVDVLSARLGGGFASFSGTSMAAPHVAGLAALAVSLGYVGLNGPDGVLAQLNMAASALPNLTAEMQGAGMVDAGKLAR